MTRPTLLVTRPEADVVSLHCPGGAAEPLVHPALLELENVVLLPHLGSATLQARTAMGMQMADNLDAFFAGRAPPNRVA
jgi:lactate dehydrogenase-like 2-hydroxyacid dehydrogenase